MMYLFSNSIIISAIKNGVKLVALLSIIVIADIFGIIWSFQTSPPNLWMMKLLLPPAMAELTLDDDEDEDEEDYQEDDDEWNLEPTPKPQTQKIPESDEITLDSPADIQAKNKQLKKQKLIMRLQKLNSLQNNKNLQESQVVSLVSQILNDDPNNLQALNTLGAFYLSQGKAKLAKIIFARALKKAPNNSAIHNNMGIIALKNKNNEQAISYFQQSLKHRYSNYTASGNLGSLYTQSYEYDSSRKYLSSAYSRAKQELAGQHPNIIKIGNNYAIALSWSGNYQKAIGIFEEILQNNKQSVEPMINYAIILARDANYKPQALQMINKADFLDHTRQYTRRIRAIKAYISQNTRKRKRQ